jgi:hypothetical protein
MEKFLPQKKSCKLELLRHLSIFFGQQTYIRLSQHPYYRKVLRRKPNYIKGLEAESNKAAESMAMVLKEPPAGGDAKVS